MMRKRVERLKLQPFTISQAKCEAVAALPPLPQTNICRPVSRDSLNHSMAWFTLFRSMDSMAFSSSARYCSGKDIYTPMLINANPISPETTRAQPHNDSAVDQQREHLRPEHRNARALQEDAAHDLDQVTQRIQVSEILHRYRHVADRIGEAAQHKRGDGDQGGRHDGLLLGAGDGRNKQTHAQAGQEKQGGAEQQHQRVAAEGDAKDY